MSRWERIEELYERALPLSAAERQAFLAHTSGDDAELRRELEAMLASTEKPLSIERLVTADGSASDPLVGAELGRWRVLAPLGHGGMGSVYLAERADGEYQQKAALKLVAPGARGPGAEERFRAERQVLARLQHPNIARLLDGGFAVDGRPYLVMELVDGAPITEHCAQRGLGTTERLRLFQVVCRAVQHAHGALVVHRDLKPANTLVSRDGEVKLLDFGIAKLLDPAALGVEAVETRELSLRLTPAYAAPEQLRGRAATTATDVYSLGVLLYELLCGVRPTELEGQTPLEMERAITSAIIVPPSRRLGRRSDDLDNIVLRALRAAPEERYASAGQLGEEIGRYLDGHPVLARPATLTYRARRFVGRNRTAVLAAAVATLSLIGFGVVAALQARAAASERDHARLERDKAERVVGVLVDLFESDNPTLRPEADRQTVRELLAQAQPRVLDQLDGQPAVRTRMQQVFGMILAARGQYAEARAALEAALDEQRRLLGPDHPEAIETLYQLGRLVEQMGDGKRSKALLAETLERSRRVFGELHESTARALTAVASPDRLEEGGAMLRQALAIRRKVLPANHPSLAENLGQLAQYHYLRGEHRQAEALYQQALAVLGDKRRHPKRMVLLSDYASFLSNLQRHAEAESRNRESLEVARALYGPLSFEVALRRNNLGTLLAIAGRHAEAEQLFRDAHASHLALLGEDSHATAGVARNLAVSVSLQGRHADGVAWMDRALSPLVKQGSGARFHMIARRAVMLVRLGRGEEAVRAVDEAAAGVRLRTGELARRTMVDVDMFRAQVLIETGRPVVALGPARGAADAMRHMPYDHPRRATAECLLGWALLASSRDGDGRALLARCLPAFRGHGLTDPAALQAIDELLAAAR
jgi:serine/threonine-protein kinase